MNLEKINQLLLEKRRYELKQKVSWIEKWKLKKEYPIQKIIGYIEMYNVKIFVSKKVLIPRYETEELVDICVKLIKKYNYKSVLDLGCGSGFIGIAIKKFNPSLEIFQSDIDKKALKQTKKNCNINLIKNTLILSNMFNEINQKFDVIISNPPYLLEDEIINMSNSVLKYEPHHALFAKDNGLYFYKIIEKNWKKYLNKNGLIILEINPINYQWFKDNDYVIINDINGKKRFAYKFNN